MSEITIGIDLGTTFSCVGVYQHGRVEIIANAQGNRITPSMVALTNVELLVGDGAKNQLLKNIENTIFDVKRLIGRRFEDDSVQEDMQRWPFTVYNDGGSPKIKIIQSNDECKTLFPEEISSMVLREMKATAEEYLGTKVTKAVITVPAYFNDGQRQATKDAGKLAGLNVVQLINEPTAAAIAFGFDKKVSVKKTILVFDLGGGTFDVSIMSIENGNFEVKAIGGDTNLGGIDFDNRMLKHFIEEFKKKHKVDLSDNKKAVQRLRTECEKAKRHLSSHFEAHIEINYIYRDIDLETSIMRAKFDELNIDLFRSTLKHVEKALLDAKLQKNQIDEIILVGGSTRIPKIQQLLQDFFDGKQLNKSINADEAVAYGAAVLAAMISGVVDYISVSDVTPLSLGIETIGGIMSTIIPRNTKTPTKKTEPYTTDIDNQTSISFQVFEGEGEMTKDNILLGKFQLCGIPPQPRLVPQLEVTFDLNVNGILKATAVEKSTGHTNNITIKNDKGRLSKEDIKKIFADAEKYRNVKAIERNRILKKNDFQNYVYEIESMIEDDTFTTKPSPIDKNRIAYKCSEIIAWLDNNPLSSIEEYQKQRKEFDEMCNPYLS